MWRAASWAVVAVLTVPLASWAQDGGDKKEEAKTTKIQGDLKADDPLDAKLKHPSKVHEFKMTKGQVVVIRLNSINNDFDPFLMVQDSTKKELAFNDDDETMVTLNSRLKFTAEKDDTFLIVVTSFDKKVGKYELIIEPEPAKDKQPEQQPNAFKPNAGAKKQGLLKTTRIPGELKLDDPPDAKLNSPSKVYEFKMTKGQSVIIRLNSKDFDAYLIVQDSARKELKFNDDDEAGGTDNSKLLFTADKDGNYLIVATSFDKGVGKYELIIEPASAKDKELDDLVSQLRVELQNASAPLNEQYKNTANAAEKERITEHLIDLFFKPILKLSEFADANADDPASKNAVRQVTNMLLKGGVSSVPGSARTLRMLLENAKSEDVRAVASLVLAEVLGKQSEAAFVKKNKKQADRLSLEAITLAKVVAEHHPLVPTIAGPLGNHAKEVLFVLTSLSVGKTAPEMEGELIDGKKFKLTDFRGKVTVVYFWGSWCAPCRAMIPHERDMAKKYEKAPLAFVGINTDVNRDKAKDFLHKEEITWTQVWDGGKEFPSDGPLSRSWRVTAYPTIYVLDGNGVIRLRSVGDPGSIFEETIEELLAEMK